MHFARTEEQTELAGTVAALLARHSDSAAVREAFAEDTGYSARLWTLLCEQVGVAALVVPEEHDGVGASLVETAIVLEELGRNLAPTPLLASALRACALLLGDDEDARDRELPEIAAGAVAPVSLGPIVLEPDERVAAMDPTLRLGPGSEPLVEGPLTDLAVALVSALQVGTMQRALDMTVAYSVERVQFGRPIGSFQALKHRMADLLVLLEASRSASWAATTAAAAYVAQPEDERARVLHQRAAVAGSYCSEALEKVAGETVQLHGGIAITWEHDAHLVFKRAHALNHLLGPAHRRRADLLEAGSGD